MSGTNPPLTPRFSVGDLAQWGKLVKSWATRQDYVSTEFVNHPPRDNSTRGYLANPPPPNVTTPDVDAQGNPKAWALPAMNSVGIPRSDGTTVSLPGAVALTRQEFTDRLAAASVPGVDVPAQYTHVIVVQGDVGTMVVRLPPRDTLQGSEEDLLNVQPYPIPAFYNEYYVYNEYQKTVDWVPPPLTAHGEIMKLHANRIGEYTLNNCA